MDSLNYSTALKIALAKINELAVAAGEKFEILADETREINQGWVFFYNTEDYIRTRDPLYALAGNGPVLILRNGQTVMLPSAASWQDVVREMPRSAGGWAA